MYKGREKKRKKDGCWNLKWGTVRKRTQKRTQRRVNAKFEEK
jgi:hypothetical protein